MPNRFDVAHPKRGGGRNGLIGSEPGLKARDFQTDLIKLGIVLNRIMQNGVMTGYAEDDGKVPA